MLFVKQVRGITRAIAKSRSIIMRFRQAWAQRSIPGAHGSQREAGRGAPTDYRNDPLS